LVGSKSDALRNSGRFDCKCPSTTAYNRLARLRDLRCCACLDVFVVVDLEGIGRLPAKYNFGGANRCAPFVPRVRFYKTSQLHE
jgi:hypothetical protein